MIRTLFWSGALLIVACSFQAMTVAHTPPPASAQTPPQPAKPGAGPGRAHGAAAKPARATPSSPVNLNTATTNELQTLPGIGKSTATRILEYRQKNGGFRKIEDLMNVKGIGEKSFLKLKPLITLTAKAVPQ